MFFKFRVAWVLCRDALGASAMRLREGKQLKEGKLNALIGFAAISEANGVRTPCHHTSFVRALEEMGFERFLYAPVWRKSRAKRGSEVLGGAFFAQVLDETGFATHLGKEVLFGPLGKRGSSVFVWTILAQVLGETGF